MDKIKKFFKNKKILITGNTGFIGSWLTLVLLSHGARISGISKDTGEINGLFRILKLKKEIFFKQMDLTDKKKTNNFFINKKFDIIIHLAAEPLVYDGYKNPSKIISNNIVSTLNLLNNLKNKKILFINFTTDKVYFNSNKTNKHFVEKDRLYGEDPYSFSKVATDLMGQMWSNSFKFSKIINIRCGNVIGGGDWKKKRLIPDIIKSHYQKKKLSLRNLNSTRPWIHILEVSNILLLLIYKKFSENFTFDVFNISPNIGDEKKVLWITKFFEKKLKTKLNYGIINIFKEKINLKLNNKKIYQYLKIKSRLNIVQRFDLTFDWYEHFYKNKSDIKNKTLNQIQEVEKVLFLK
jgi:CDP-glucose 4,6-dehydratase